MKTIPDVYVNQCGWNHYIMSSQRKKALLSLKPLKISDNFLILVEGGILKYPSYSTVVPERCGENPFK